MKGGANPSRGARRRRALSRVARSLQRRGLARLARNRSGAAAVEFALIAPALLMMLLAIIQFGITLNNYLELTDGIRVGARQFAVSGTSTTPMTTATALVKASAANLSGSSITLTFKVNGTTCSSDSACATALAAGSGQSAAVTGTYPCSLTVMGVSFVSSCTLTSTTTEMVE
jgi:Flp pilus assembly protein TadG